MRILERNKQDVYYCLFDHVEPVKDELGNETGERKVFYKPPERARMSVSFSVGVAQVEQFGTNLDYDRVLITDDMKCPITENSVLFIGKPPEFDSDGNPIYNYWVRKVARSLNGISYAVKEAMVS